MYHDHLVFVALMARLTAFFARYVAAHPMQQHRSEGWLSCTMVFSCLAQRPVWPGAASIPSPSTQLLQRLASRTCSNVTRLTFDGDNGEAYFSWDNTKLIWQSNHEATPADKIWTMNIDGTDKRLVSPSAWSPYLRAFSSPATTRLCLPPPAICLEECPPKPQHRRVTGKHRYTWPLYPYDIFVARADSSDATSG